ncbi:MAG: peroxiredoxin-like family protein [Methyloceanibacter sp.]
MLVPTFQSVAEAFRYCADMDAPLAERLNVFSQATRYLLPGYQEAADRIAARLDDYGACRSAPSPGDPMPDFTLPDERGKLVSLASLLRVGPFAVTFHRGHWCPYCRINTKALAEAQANIAAEGAQIVAIMPDRQKFAAAFKTEAKVRYSVLTDVDNGYALSLNLAIWLGDEMNQILLAGGREVPDYQGNDTWFFPIPAAFVVGMDGRVTDRFIDPDYRRRMSVEHLLAALRKARAERPFPPW